MVFDRPKDVKSGPPPNSGVLVQGRVATAVTSYSVLGIFVDSLSPEGQSLRIRWFLMSFVIKRSLIKPDKRRHQRATNQGESRGGFPITQRNAPRYFTPCRDLAD